MQIIDSTRAAEALAANAQVDHINVHYPDGDKRLHAEIELVRRDGERAMLAPGASTEDTEKMAGRIAGAFAGGPLPVLPGRGAASLSNPATGEAYDPHEVGKIVLEPVVRENAQGGPRTHSAQAVAYARDGEALGPVAVAPERLLGANSVLIGDTRFPARDDANDQFGSDAISGMGVGSLGIGMYGVKATHIAIERAGPNCYVPHLMLDSSDERTQPFGQSRTMFRNIDSDGNVRPLGFNTPREAAEASTQFTLANAVSNNPAMELASSAVMLDGQWPPMSGRAPGLDTPEVLPRTGPDIALSAGALRNAKVGGADNAIEIEGEGGAAMRLAGPFGRDAERQDAHTSTMAHTCGERDFERAQGDRRALVGASPETGIGAQAPEPQTPGAQTPEADTPGPSRLRGTLIALAGTAIVIGGIATAGTGFGIAAIALGGYIAVRGARETGAAGAAQRAATAEGGAPAKGINAQGGPSNERGPEADRARSGTEPKLSAAAASFEPGVAIAGAGAGNNPSNPSRTPAPGLRTPETAGGHDR